MGVLEGVTQLSIFQGIIQPQGSSFYKNIPIIITDFHTIIASGTISISAPNTEEHAIVTLFACH